MAELLPGQKTQRTKTRYWRRLSALRKEASSWRPHWRDLADHILPRRQRFETGDKHRAGTKKNDKIINNTATMANRILASGMMAGITSPARPWFRLRTPDAALNEQRAVRSWLAAVERTILEIFARSNIYTALPQAYSDLGCFGVTSVFVEDHPEDVIHARILPVGSYYLAQDQYNRVNSMYRETTLTVEQIARRFPRDNWSEHVRSQFEAKAYDTPISCVHIVEPNDEVIHDRLDPKGMPWRSVWFEGSASGAGDVDHLAATHSVPGILGEFGFNEKPFMAPRWSTTGDDVYGNSPAMDSLGDVRSLQHLERRLGQAVDKIINPPMTGPAALKKMRASLLAGDITYVDTQGTQKFEPAIKVDPRVRDAERDILRMENRINRAFFADLFLMLANTSIPNMTAREVEERHEEKMLQLGPVLERLHDELLDPLIDRTFGIIERQGLLPPIPEELSGADLRVEYISILAQAQKLVATATIERLATFTSSLAQAQPEVLDKLNGDKMVDDYGETIGADPELIRSNEQVAELRQQRAQAAQLNQESARAARDAAVAAKTASETTISEDDSALNRLVEAYSNGAQAAA
ncbi:MAG: hypothetical protein GY723_04815 [bacterium]|nr:hypothetical protein [bacterium]